MSANDPTEIERTTVDGVPTFWATAATRLVGALMFRVGRVDEPLPQGGLSHFVEHLALYGLGGKQAYEYNGLVDALHVAFHAVGTPEQLVEYFGHVCGALRALPLERAAHEARVLRTEAAGRSDGAVPLSLWYRYGARGFGALRYREFGLDRPDASAIASWAADHFTAGNAAAWFSGPIPVGLRFDLPDGPRRPAPDPLPLADLVLPSWAPGPSGIVSISMVGSRQDWILIPARIAALRIEKRLRYEKALTYSVAVGYLVSSRDSAHTILGATTLDSHANDVQADMLNVLHTLAMEGPTEAELAVAAADWEREFCTTEAITGSLASCAFNELLGSPTRSPVELRDEIRAMTPASVGKVLHDALKTALLMIPDGVKCTHPSYKPPAYQPERRVIGTSYRSVKAPFPWSKKQLELIAGLSGVSLVDAAGHSATVRFADLAVAVERKDGGVDLIGNDGYHLSVLASDWRGGTRALERIRQSIPADRFVRGVE